MKNVSLFCKIALLVALVTVGGGILLRQHRQGAQLRNKIVELDRENERLAQSKATKQSPDAVVVPAPTTPERQASPTTTPSSPARTGADRTTATSAEPSPNPETDMVAVEGIQYAGRTTPTAAFQTFVWAALSGNDAELAGSLALRGHGREKMTELWAALPPESRAKFPSPESIPAIYAAEQTVRKLQSIRILETRMSDENTADLFMRITNRSGRTSDQDPLRMIREGGEWRVLLPDNMVEIISQKLLRQTPASPGQ